jgi:hypothetical protein
MFRGRCEAVRVTEKTNVNSPQPFHEAHHRSEEQVRPKQLHVELKVYARRC